MSNNHLEERTFDRVDNPREGTHTKCSRESADINTRSGRVKE
jgi:hypothetical protein